MKKKTKCLSIQKKVFKKLEKIDLRNNYKYLLKIYKLKNKKRYMINLHKRKFWIIKDLIQRVKDS